MPTLIIVADAATDASATLSRERRSFQMKERVTASDVGDPHIAAQLIERIGWALVEAEYVEHDVARRTRTA